MKFSQYFFISPRTFVKAVLISASDPTAFAGSGKL